MTSYPIIQQYIGPSLPVDGGSQNGLIPDTENHNRLLVASSGSTSTCGYRNFDVDTGVQTSQATIAALYGSVSPYSIPALNVLGHDGQIVTTKRSFSGAWSTYALIDPDTFTESATFNATNSPSTLPDGIQIPQTMAPSSIDGKSYVVTAPGLPYGTYINVLEAHGTTMRFAGHTFTWDEVQAYVGETRPDTGITYMIGRGPNASSALPLGLYKTTITAGADGYNPASWPGSPNSHISTTKIGTISPAQVDATWSHFINVSEPGYDETDGKLLFVVQTLDSAAHQCYVIKVDPADASVVWTSPVGSGAHGTFRGGRVKDGLFTYGAVGNVYQIDTSDGSATVTALTGVTILNSIWDANTASLFCFGGYIGSSSNPTPAAGTAAWSGSNFFRLIMGPIAPPLAGNDDGWFDAARAITP